MKPALVIALGVSVAANAVLAVVAVSSRHASSSFASQASAAELAARSAVEQRTATEAALAAAKSDAEKNRSAVWKSIASDDLATLVANLRAAGFPEKQVRAIVGSAISERFSAERRRLLGEDQVQPFWKPQSAPFGYDRATADALRKLSREQRDLMKQVLGSDYVSEEALGFMQRRYGPLPAERIEAIRRIESDYADLSSEVRGDFGGILLPEDRENLTMLEKEKQKDIAALLSPAERETYELYSSNTANLLRRNMDSFNPTEQEFRAVFALQKEFDDANSRFAMSGGIPDEATMKSRRAAEQALKEKIRTTLGDQRYEEYQRAQDTGYRSAARIADRYKLPAENAVAVYNLQKEAQQKMSSFRGDRDAAAAYARETSERIGQLLGGARGLEAYRTMPGGLWLRAFERYGATPAIPRP